MSRFSAALRPWSASSNLSAFQKFTAALRRFGDSPPMLAIREALPWSVAGLVAGLIVFAVLEPVRGPVFGTLLKRISLAELPAFGIMAISLAAILPYRLAKHLRLTAPVAIAGSLAAFALALPRPYDPQHAVAYLGRIGQSGLFLAILTGLFVAAACSIARRAIRQPIAADIAGAAFVVLVAVALYYADVSVGNFLIAALSPLGRLGDTFTALLIIVLVETLLWLIGVHGPATLAAIVTPVYLALQQQNAAAYADHRALPHIVVVSLFLFVFPGGAGATLPLAALLAVSKVGRLRKVGRLTIVPAIFNINEPLMFGLPVAYNPYLAVPFVVTPMVLATISYLAVARGFIARPAIWVPSSFPTIAATYLATSDVRAIVLVCVNLAVATLLYLPFVRAYERHEAQIAA